MQIFELYFNPKNEEGKIIKAFAFDKAKSPTEKKLGNLYAVGEAKSKDVKFLDRLAQAIKEKYYQPGMSTEKSFSETLKHANEFLSQEVKKENVDWLGNLSFAIFSLKDSELIFTKTGNLKVLLLRQGRIRPTEEAIQNALVRVPGHRIRAVGRVLGAVIDFYWMMIDSAHAALMKYGEVPPSPEYVESLLSNTFVKKGLLKQKYVGYYHELWQTSKAIIHGEVVRIGGADYDRYQRMAEEFEAEMKKLVEKKK